MARFMTTPIATIQLETQNRGIIYKRLSDCYRSPDHDFVTLIKELVSAVSAYDADIRGHGIRIQPEQTVDMLKIEHARLFIGPFSLPVPPYESMYRGDEDTLMNQSSIVVQEWYLSEGMELAIKEAPDHIRIELEFMYFLIYQEHIALEQTTLKESDKITVHPYVVKQRDFLREHLSQWIPAFEGKVLTHAHNQLYKDLAILTRRFIDADLRYLQNMINGYPQE